MDVRLTCCVVKTKLSINSGKWDVIDPQISETHSYALFATCCTTNFNTVVEAKIYFTVPMTCGKCFELRAVELRNQFRRKVSSEVTSHLSLLHNPYTEHVQRYGNVRTLHVLTCCMDFRPMVVACGSTLRCHTSVTLSLCLITVSKVRPVVAMV